MKTVNINNNQSDTYSGMTIVGLRFALQLQILPNIGLPYEANPQSMLMRNTSIQAKLRRGGGQPVDILATSYDVIHKIANYEANPPHAIWMQNLGLAAAVNPYFADFILVDSVLQLANSGVADIRLICAEYLFEKPLNLSGNDEVTVTVNFAPGSLISAAPGYADTTSSQMLFAEIEGDGIECGVPKLEIASIQEDQANLKVSAGSGVGRVLFINTDRQDHQIANSVIQNLTLQSSLKNHTVTYNELLAIRSNKTASFWDDFHIQDFDLFQGEMADDVTINFQFNVTNVSSGQNYVAVEKVACNNDDIARYHATRSYDHMEHLAKHGALPASMHAQFRKMSRPQMHIGKRR